MSNDYDPRSSDSQFTEILTRLAGQDDVLEKLLEQARKTNGRLTALEIFRALVMFLGGIGMMVLGSMATAFFDHLFK